MGDRQRRPRADAKDGPRQPHSQRELAEQVALGIKKAPTSCDLAKTRNIEDVIVEYLDFGRAQGGRGGQPWGAVHSPDEGNASEVLAGPRPENSGGP